MYYILFYKTVDNYVEKRKPFRQAHLNYAKQANERGELILAGALESPVDSAVLIFKGDKSVPENFVKNDPYVKNNLITGWSIRPWTVVVGG